MSFLATNPGALTANILLVLDLIIEWEADWIYLRNKVGAALVKFENNCIMGFGKYSSWIFYGFDGWVDFFWVTSYCTKKLYNYIVI